MNYSVRILIPIAIRVEAKNEKQAQKQAWDFLKSQAQSDVWLVPLVYKGKSMHEMELEKTGR